MATSGGTVWRLPMPAWARSYRRDWLRPDLFAGVLLAGILVPQGLAYAGIAGVLPQHGLYAMAAGLLAYSLFGTSRHLAVSPTSSSAALLAAALASIAGSDAWRHVALAALSTILVGIFFLLGRLLRLGFISEFIAKPVLKGFIVGLALTVSLKQAPDLLGVPPGKGSFFVRLWDIVQVFPQAHVWTLTLGLAFLAALLLLGHMSPRFPGPLAVLAAGLALSWWLDLGHRGVALVSISVQGSPGTQAASITWPEAVHFGEMALGIAVVLFAESISSARILASRHGEEVDANRELFALGLCNLASGAVQGIPVGGGLSGSVANEAAGAKSQASSAVASALTVLAVAFLLPLFMALPKAILAAVVIATMAGLVDVTEFLRYKRLGIGLDLSLVALLAVLLFGLLSGLFLAVALNVAWLLYHLSKPHCSVLARMPGSDTFVEKDHFPQAEEIPGLLIFRPDSRIIFANAHFVAEHLWAQVKARAGNLKEVLLSLDLVPDLDVDGLDLLVQIKAELDAQGIALALCRTKAFVHEMLERGGVIDSIGQDRVFFSQKDAVHDYIRRNPDAESRLRAVPPEA